MWATVGKLLLSAAVWCLRNPDKVDKGLSEVITLVKRAHGITH